MLTLPDFKEKQILIIQPTKDEDYKLKFWNSNLRLMVEGKAVNQLSCYKIFAIFIVGDLTFTSQLLRQCSEFGISIVFMKRNFEVYALLGAVAEGNYLLRMKQYSLGAVQQVHMAKKVVANKIWNQIALLEETKKLQKPKALFKEQAKKVEGIEEYRSLLGFEGTMSKVFFQQYYEPLGWYRRMPRAKIDYINVLLDIGYTLLFNFVDALLRLYGFDTYKGFYHQLFFQRKSLTCDIVEPFRCIIDKAILKGKNLGQIKEEDFERYKGQVRLPYNKQAPYMKLFLSAILEEKEEIFTYVRDFYFAVLNDTGEYPFYSISRR